MKAFKDNIIVISGTALVAAAFLFAFAVNGARAADKGGPQEYLPAADVRSAWTGCYIGAGAGLTSVSAEVGKGAFSVDGLGAQGQKGVLQIGCDMRLSGSPLVFGLFGEYGIANTEFSVNPGIFSAKMTNNYAVGGRLGYVFQGAMPYVLLAYQHTDAEWSIAAPGLPGSFRGYAVGGGIEMPLAKNLSFDVSGRWTKYQSESVGPISIEPTELAVMAAIKLRFGQ